MQSAPLILDEWMIHDLRGDNCKKCQTEAIQFLERIFQKCDHLLVLHNSPWMKKAYQLMIESDPRVRYASVSLWVKILSNSAKCTKLYDDEIPDLPDDLQKAIGCDDSYLVALHLAVPDSTIVTTDHDLVEVLSKFNITKTSLRNDFLQKYV